MSDAIRRWILRVIVVVGYVPTFALLWLAGGQNWRTEHRTTMHSMWRGHRH